MKTRFGYLEHLCKDDVMTIGLGHALSGIMAYLSPSIILSATMAWNWVGKVLRFNFFHFFEPILYSHVESWL